LGGTRVGALWPKVLVAMGGTGWRGRRWSVWSSSGPECARVGRVGKS
jgi:hypothetical protein